MSNKQPKDSAFDIADSTDWLETPISSLAALDSALRCQVCKDFYENPMITSCQHTFCSLCIRRSLSNDGKCPACRANEQELKLRRNGALEDAVEAFKRSRAAVLEFARKPAAMAESALSKRSRDENLEDDESPVKKKTRTSGRRTRATEPVVIPDSDDGDGDYVPGRNFRYCFTIFQPNNLIEDGLVQCPICQKSVKAETINTHIDRGCADEPRATKPLSRSTTQISGPSDKPIKKPERLPAINYHMVRENALRKKLTDLGLSGAGGKPLLEKRYTEWITLWNANCDATKPKTKNELKRELDIWERTQGGRAQAGGVKDPGAQIREKDFDGQAWSSKHDDTFKDLIANARRKAAVKASSTESKEKTVEATKSSTSVAESTAVPESPRDFTMDRNGGDRLRGIQ